MITSPADGHLFPVVVTFRRRQVRTSDARLRKLVVEWTNRQGHYRSECHVAQLRGCESMAYEAWAKRYDTFSLMFFPPKTVRRGT